MSKTIFLFFLFTSFFSDTPQNNCTNKVYTPENIENDSINSTGHDLLVGIL